MILLWIWSILSIKSPWLTECLPPYLIPTGIHFQCKIISVDNSCPHCSMAAKEIISIIVHQDVKNLTVSTCKAKLLVPLYTQRIGQLDKGSIIQTCQSSSASNSNIGGRSYNISTSFVFPVVEVCLMILLRIFLLDGNTRPHLIFAPCGK